VNRAQRSIVVDVAEDAGVRVPSSCQAGTCETRVAAGIPAHGDAVLSDDEEAADDHMMICVSRALPDSLMLRIRPKNVSQVSILNQSSTTVFTMCARTDDDRAVPTWGFFATSSS
jgi:ferredoxin